MRKGKKALKEQNPAKDDLQMESPADAQPQEADSAVAVMEKPETEIAEVPETAVQEVPDQETTEVTESTEETEPAEVAESAEATESTEVAAEPAETPEEAPAPVVIWQKPPYHERYYLRYHEGKRAAPMDLEGTRKFLQDIGFDGGELRMAREGKDRAENLRGLTSGKNNQMRCSYCGAEIAGVEFYRLPDGRLRCTSCSNSVVKNKAEVEELCKRVLANMDNFFGADIDVDVAIEMVEERKLKRKIGVPLGIRDNQSILVLGAAINKKKKYTILLENGAPRISLIATFAHELTHIWQYIHWDAQKDFRQCPKSKRLLIYEGMAKWAEIQYLYLIGETAVARREEYITRNRRDEYGLGFCLYEDRYPLSRDAMTCEDTPFTPGRYPFD